MNRYLQVRDAIHQRWLQRARQSEGTRRHEDLRYQIGGLTEEVLRENAVVLTEKERRVLIQEVQDEVQGYGPLEPLMQDPAITDILVNGPDAVYYEKHGRLTLSDTVFINSEHVRAVLDRMLLLTGRRIDESSPMVDARLPSGARLHALLPPIAPDGIALSIRKFSEERLDLMALVERGTLSSPQAELLTEAVRAECNVLICGGTGSGKTTLLNALAEVIPPEERVLTLEEAAELRLHLPHVIRLEARPANIEGRGEISVQTLLRNALRMRPDRIIVGEVRGREVFDMLQAMNSGHRGSLATVHANGPRDALIRLESLMAETGWVLSIDALRQQLASAIQIIVHLRRDTDGKRRMTSISEVVGLAAGKLLLEDIGGFQRDRGFFLTGVPVGAIERRGIA